MGVEYRERKFWHSTDAIEYCIEHSEARLRYLNSSRSCGCFFATTIDSARLPGEIFCFSSQAGTTEEADYYKAYEQKFLAKLRSQYPDLSTLCANKVAETFTEFLVIANASHQCPQFGEFITTTILYFRLQPRSHTVPLPVELIICEEMEEDEEEEEEEADFYLRMRPATRASITELLLKAKAAPDQDDANCGICMEGIEKNMMLRLPCSHPFHRLCLLHWLNNGHSCPICRYRLPAARHRIDVTETH